MDAARHIGFIGGGEMAYALAMSFISGGEIKPSRLHVSNPSAAKLQRFSCKGINVTQNNMDVFDSCSVVLLCVKPQIFPTVVKELNRDANKYILAEKKLIISVMAAIKIDNIQSVFANSSLVRIVPNTAALVNCSMTILTAAPGTSDHDLKYVESLLEKCGSTTILPERLIDAGQAISGCGPGLMMTAIDAFADGGVKMGLPRATALKLAAAMLAGSGRLYLETGIHPGALKDQVTSPGGVTICAIHELEKGGFRNTIINAVEAATNKSLELGRAAKK